MSDDRFDQFLKREAATYNPPPPTPRDELWARIETARSDTGVKGIAPVFRRPWLRAVTAVAALLVLGIGIGRWTAPGRVVETEIDVASNEDMETDARVFRVAAVEHLGQLDTFISLFRADAVLGRSDPETGPWASELLVTTRLMMDSPAGDDVRMRQLLEDLEFVLAQITEYVGRRDRTELELIQQDLKEQDLLLRLQTELTVSAPVQPVQGEI